MDSNNGNKAYIDITSSDIIRALRITSAVDELLSSRDLPAWAVLNLLNHYLRDVNNKKNRHDERLERLRFIWERAKEDAKSPVNVYVLEFEDTPSEKVTQAQLILIQEQIGVQLTLSEIEAVSKYNEGFYENKATPAPHELLADFPFDCIISDEDRDKVVILNSLILAKHKYLPRSKDKDD